MRLPKSSSVLLLYYSLPFPVCAVMNELLAIVFLTIITYTSKNNILELKIKLRNNKQIRLLLNQKNNIIKQKTNSKYK